MTTAERIRQARQAAGLTQREVGERCGIAEPTIRRYEAGKLNPKFETIQKIANALGVSAAYLMGMEDPPAPSIGLGARIKAAREAAGMTQKELAKEIGTSNSCVSNWEQGLNRPDADLLASMCTALHVSPAYLLGIEDDPTLSRLAAQLNAAGRDKLIAYAEDLILSGRYTP